MTVADVALLLGEPDVVAGGALDQLEMADAVDDGLSPAAIERIKQALGLSDADLARILGISAKTINRLRKTPDRHLSSTASDRLYRMARLYVLATEVLEDPEAAQEWLRSPQIGLNRRPPVDLMSTEAGSREVEYLLLRIEHGVIA
jgi:putative toxin-antitoxin system antitoxin component (TIGR02293 family)